MGTSAAAAAAAASNEREGGNQRVAADVLPVIMALKVKGKGRQERREEEEEADDEDRITRHDEVLTTTLVQILDMILGSFMALGFVLQDLYPFN